MPIIARVGFDIVRLVLGGVIFGGNERLVARCGRAERYIVSWLASNYRHVDMGGCHHDQCYRIVFHFRAESVLDRGVAALLVATDVSDVLR